jgi:hypothetical protein
MGYIRESVKKWATTKSSAWEQVCGCIKTASSCYSGGGTTAAGACTAAASSWARR